ncbi:MAG TPA: hypothetical protein VL727_20385 [Puia sp.]|nr:hypothetical protein [Puia sp.]
MKPILPYVTAAGLLFCNILHAQQIDPDALSLKKGIKINGGLGLSSVYYSSNGVASYQPDPFTWFATGNLNISLFGINTPFSFSYSNAHAQYTQPFNRLRILPKYKWVRLYLGTSSMNFSNYTLAGYTFNGYGVELTPGHFSFKAMYGRLKEAIPYNFIDTLNNANLSYRRKGMGFSMAYNGKGESYSLNVFKAKDDSNSLRYVPPQSGLYPENNLAVSVAVKKMLSKKISFDGEYAVSALTANLAAKDDGTASYPSTVASTLIRPFFKGTNDTRYYDAMAAGIGYTGKNYGLQLRYERVSPGYVTLGAYYINSDMENITIAPQVRLLKSKLNLSANVGIQHDNLDKSKPSTTHRFVGTFNGSYAMSAKWIANIGYSNFNTYTRVRPVADPFFQNGLDSLNFYQVSQSFTGNLMHNFGSKAHPQNLNLNMTYQLASNKSNTDTTNPLTRFFTSILNYAYSMPQKGLVFSAAANYYINSSPGLNSVFYGPTLSLGHRLFAGMTSNWAVTVNKNTINGAAGPGVMTERWNLNYLPQTAGGHKKLFNGHHSITSSLGYTHHDKASTTAAYDEWMWNLTYNYSF